MAPASPRRVWTGHFGSPGRRPRRRPCWRAIRAPAIIGAILTEHSRGIPLSESTKLPGVDALPEIAQGLADVEVQLSEAVLTADPFISEITTYLLKAGGKRVRPALALLGSKFGDGINENAVDAGVAVELIHLGSLYHDDVIDESDTRRGLASVNANWNNTIAILAGDYLLSKASEIGARLGREASELLARTLGSLVKGELRELANAYNAATTADDYWMVIENKTAALIATSIRLGGMVGGASIEVVDQLSEYGYRLGMVFQIADDVLDITATEEQLGKPAGLDVIEGTYTLPVIHALASDRGDDLRAILGDSGGDAAGRIGESEVIRIREILHEAGSINHALALARENLKKADAALANLPDGPSHDALAAMGEYILARVPLPEVS